VNIFVAITGIYPTVFDSMAFVSDKSQQWRIILYPVCIPQMPLIEKIKFLGTANVFRVMYGFGSNEERMAEEVLQGTSPLPR
jgi:hypothetical protein